MAEALCSWHDAGAENTGCFAETAVGAGVNAVGRAD